MSLKSELRTLFKTLTGLECYSTKIENATSIEYPCLLLTTSYNGRSNQSDMCDITIKDFSGTIIVLAEKANELDAYETLILNGIDGRVGDVGSFPALRMSVSNSIDIHNYTTGQYEQNIDFIIVGKK